MEEEGVLAEVLVEEIVLGDRLATRRCPVEVVLGRDGARKRLVALRLATWRGTLLDLRLSLSFGHRRFRFCRSLAFGGGRGRRFGGCNG